MNLILNLLFIILVKYLLAKFVGIVIFFYKKIMEEEDLNQDIGYHKENVNILLLKLIYFRVSLLLTLLISCANDNKLH